MKNNFYKLLTTVIICANLNSGANAIEHDYPKSKQEKKAEEIGSIMGGEGLVFTPSKIKNLSTKATNDNSIVNKYLWESALDAIKDLPLISSDSVKGTLITDWYNSPKMPNYSYKVEIFITGDVISPESLSVKVFEKGPKIKGIEQAKDLEATFEDKILRRGRALYIKEERK